MDMTENWSGKGMQKKEKLKEGKEINITETDKDKSRGIKQKSELKQR